MLQIIVIISGFIWVACAFIAAGFDYAHFQSEWPQLAVKERRSDTIKALFFSFIFGPVALIISITKGRHGWRLPGRPLPGERPDSATSKTE